MNKLIDLGAHILFYIYYLVVEIPIALLFITILIILLLLYIITNFIQNAIGSILYNLLCDNNINKYPWCKRLRPSNNDSDQQDDDNIEACIRDCIMKKYGKKQNVENNNEQYT